MSAISKHRNIDYKDMIFFDDEPDNIRTTNRIGVTAVHCPNRLVCSGYIHIVPSSNRDSAAQTSPCCADITVLRRHHLAAQTSPRCADITVLRRHHRAAQTSPCCADIAVLRRHHFAAQTSLRCADITVLHRHHLAAQTLLCCADITVLRGHFLGTFYHAF